MQDITVVGGIRSGRLTETDVWVLVRRVTGGDNDCQTMEVVQRLTHFVKI